MEETQITRKEEGPQNPNPLLCLLTQFTNSFNLLFPKKAADKKPRTATGSDTQLAEPAAGESEYYRPIIVKVPNTQTVEPLKLVGEEGEQQQDTNPVVLWQVYAIGGFFIIRWAWARWNERKANKKSSGEDAPPADD